MSALVYRYCVLVCDLCSEALDVDAAQIRTAPEARAMGKIFGWRRVGGRDVCFRHAAVSSVPTEPDKQP